MMDVVSTKVLAMALLGGGSLILGFIPLKLTRFMGWSEGGSHSRRKNIVTSILLCFGAGVLLATSFIHILPEVRDGLLHSGHVFGRLPMAEFFFCCGFFLIYFIEELVHASMAQESPEAELRSALKRIGSLSASFRRGAENGLSSAKRGGHTEETGLNDAELQNVNNQIASLDEVDIQTSPMGNGAEDLNDGQLSESETPVGTYNPKYRIKLNQSVHKMFPNYHPPDKKKKIEPEYSRCCTLESKLCSISVRDFVTIAALSFHSIFEGLAIGLEGSTEDVWQLFGAIACHKFVITFCVGLELATNDTKLLSFIAYMMTFCMASPIGIGIGIGVSETSMLENPAHHFLTVSALQGISAGTILYVVVFEILQREKSKSVSGLLQLTFLILGFAVMVCIEVFGGHLHVHDIAETHSHHCTTLQQQQQLEFNDSLPEIHDHSEQGEIHHPGAGLFPMKSFPHKDSDHHHKDNDHLLKDVDHDSHIKDFHGAQVPEQELPPPTLDKNSTKLRLNVTSKRVLKVL